MKEIMYSTNTQVVKACKGMCFAHGGMNIPDLKACMGYSNSDTTKTGQKLRTELALWCKMEKMLPAGFESTFDVDLVFSGTISLMKGKLKSPFNMAGNTDCFITRASEENDDLEFTAFDRQAFSRKRPLIMPMSLEFDGVHVQTDTTDSLFTEEYVYSHQNVFIQDGLTLYRYEPMFRPDKAMLALDATIQKKLKDGGYIYVHDMSSPGVQNRYPGENCVLYCAFFIHTFLEQYVQTHTTRQAYDNTMKQIRTWCTSGEYSALLLTFTRNVLDCTTKQMISTEIVL